MEDKEGLDCPVCLEPYNEALRVPKMMPCLHTLCASCILSLTSPAPRQEPETQPPQESVASSSQGTHVWHTFERFSSQPDLFSRSAATENTLSSPTPHVPPKPTAASIVRKRPQVKPPTPPQPAVPSEPQIPKGVTVLCPLCRSKVSTSKLQTNRYVLAHMKDLARLAQLSPGSPFPAPGTQPTSPPLNPKDFWCQDCKQPATDACLHHASMPMTEWIATQKAILESSEVEVEEKVTKHSAHLRSIETMMKTVYHSLNKASRFVWQANAEVEEIKSQLRDQFTTTATASPQENIEQLMCKVEQMEQLMSKVSKEQLVSSNEQVTVQLRQETHQLVIHTKNPHRVLVLTLAEGLTDV